MRGLYTNDLRLKIVDVNGYFAANMAGESKDIIVKAVLPIDICRFARKTFSIMDRKVTIFCGEMLYD